jgi:hypothetical protein
MYTMLNNVQRDTDKRSTRAKRYEERVYPCILSLLISVNYGRKLCPLGKSAELPRSSCV